MFAAAVALLGGCAIETQGLGIDEGGLDARIDRRARDARASDGADVDGRGGDGGSDDARVIRDAGGPPDTSPTCDPAACDDGVFCNGVETCVDGACASPGDPCTASALLCDETASACVSCLSRADCPPVEIGSWGDCSYDTDCGESGERARTVADYACTMGSCAPFSTVETDSSGCMRDTDGDDCRRDGLSCTYDVCSDGSCTHPCVDWCRCWSSGCSCSSG